MREPADPPFPASSRCINVIGPLSSASGLGNTSRLFTEVLRHNGYQVAGFDIESYAAAEVPPLEHGMLKTRLDDLPFDHNLVIASLNRLPQLWIRHAKELVAPRFRNAGLVFWELPTIPYAWLPSLRMFDVILACSHYVRQALEAAIPEVPTIFAEHPLARHTVDRDRQAARLRFGIPAERTAFFCGLDLVSGTSRKNPAATIRAWLQAFPNDADVCLVIKLNGNSTRDLPNDGLFELLAQMRAEPRIILIDQRLPHDDLMALYDCCDVCVSLHRSEGLGLIPMESMSMGKLVVATGYSGNMTFMTEQNSLPVPYRLIPPMPEPAYFSRRFAGPTSAWADPDADEAARLIRAAKDPALLQRLGQQAFTDIRQRQQTAWDADYLAQMTARLRASDRHLLRPALRRQAIFQEFWDETLRRKNVRALLGRITSR